MSFANAPEVKEVATKYINEHHTHLANAPIEYIFSLKTIKKKGKEQLGEMAIVSGKPAFLMTRDFENPLEQIFVMTISKQAWNLLEDKPEVREAIVDHELAHAGTDENGALTILPHDIEEFSDIVARHGAYMKDIQVFLTAAKSAKRPQLSFDLDLARENQERDTADREDREAERSLDDEKKAAVSTKVTVIKRGKKGEEQERATASGE